MTVSATPYKESYAGNGVTTVFPVPFYFLADTDLVVSDVNDTTGVITPLALTTDYTVSGALTPTGGAVTLLVATASGHHLTIERSLVEDQPTHFVDGDPLPAAGLEQALDRIVMLYQQAKTALDRAAKFVVGSTSTTDLPEPVEGTVLGWVGGKLANLAAGTAQLAADLLSTAVGKGAALISYLAPFTGAAARTQQSKNADSVSILDFGGSPDGVTDTTTPLSAASTAVSNIGVVRFPHIPGTANVYYFSTFLAGTFPNIVFDVDPGVVLSTASDDVMATTTTGLQFMRPTTFYWRGLGRYVTLGETRVLDGTTRPKPQKDLFVGPGDFDFSSMSSVVCNSSQVTPLYIPWNASDTWSADSFTAYTTTSFSRTIASVDGNFHLGMLKAIPGMEYSAEIVITAGAPMLLALIRHTNGFTGLRWSGNTTTPTIEQFNKVTGSSGTALTASYIWESGAGKHMSYHPINAVITIRIVSWTRADILFNGFVAGTFPIVGGSIFQVGFGGYATGSGGAYIVRNVVQTIGKPPTFNNLLSIRVFGDSRSAPHIDSWVSHLKNALDMTAGIRAWKIDNQAVSGHTSSQQWTVMQSVGVTDVDAVIINVGTNDVQGAAGVSTFTTNLTNMIDMVQAAGKYCIVANFDMWYGQAQANGTGQNSLNYDQGAQYRAALLEVCATKGVKVVDETCYSGPVLGQYVYSGLGVDLTTAGDPYVQDNIHETPAANRLRALHVARAFCGLIMPQVSLKQSATALTNVQNGWSASLQQPYATIDASGNVTMDGILTAGTKTNGTVILILPNHLWPPRTKRFRVYGDVTTEVLSLNVDASTGEVSVYGMSSASYLSLDSLTWNLA